MPTLVIDRLEPPSSARRARSSDLGRARAADRLAGRTVWCATALPSGRGAARMLRGCLIADGCVPDAGSRSRPTSRFVSSPRASTRRCASRARWSR